MTPRRRLLLDCAGMTVGLLVLVGVIVFLVDGVEQARQLAEGGLSGAEWGRQVLARLPGRVLAGLPVIGAVSVASVVAWWGRTGRLDAWSLCGGAPGQLASAAAAGVLVVALTAATLREVAAPWAVQVLAGQGAWVAVEEGPDMVMVRAEHLLATEARAVRVAWLSNGVVVGAGSARAAVWNGDEWVLTEARGVRWPDLTQPAPLVLPEPARWRRQAVELGMDSPLMGLVEAPAGAPRSAWLAERAVTLLGVFALAWLAVPITWRHPRWGVLMVLGLAGAWRVLHVGLVVISARGVLSVWAGVAIVVGVLVAAGVVLVASGPRAAALR